VAWFDEFFDEHYLGYWAQMLDEERTACELAFIRDKLGLQDGAKVLDLCCGQARHAVELAKSGWNVTGLDLNEFLLDRARDAAGDAGVDVRFVRADMREIPFENEFDAVINLFTAFGYFEDDAENQRVLESVARCLKPGGRFLIDHTHVLCAARDFQPDVWRQYADGTIQIEEREFDARQVRFRTKATFLKPDGSQAERCNDIRCYTCAELCHMLRAAALDVQEVYGGFDGSELTIESKRLIIISRTRAAGEG